MEGVWTCERHLTGAPNEAFAASPEYCYFCTLEERDRLRAEGWPRSPEIHALNRVCGGSAERAGKRRTRKRGARMRAAGARTKTTSTQRRWTMETRQREPELRADQAAAHAQPQPRRQGQASPQSRASELDGGPQVALAQRKDSTTSIDIATRKG